jgi:hypothetical protein
MSKVSDLLDILEGAYVRSVTGVRSGDLPPDFIDSLVRAHREGRGTDAVEPPSLLDLTAKALRRAIEVGESDNALKFHALLCEMKKGAGHE